MKIIKKFATILISAILCLGIATVAFAAGDYQYKNDIAGYEKLEGWIGGTYTEIGVEARIASNPDRAYLKIKTTGVDTAGTTTRTFNDVTSNKGETHVDGSFSDYFEGVYRVYGAHNVQGGGTYGAAVVYTTARLTQNP